jgi:3-oxoacyl-[acyl-carrier protein] reductase
MTNEETVLVTGSNGGIGNEVAKLLIGNNYKVVLCYHKNRENLDALVKENKEKKNNIKIQKLDLLVENNIDNVLESILNETVIDIFIHLPTFPYEHKNILESEWSDFQKNIDLQTKSLFKISQHIVPKMKMKKRGKIISILTSYVVGKPPNGISNYITGKYSQLGMLKCMAVELGKFGISVNSVSPSIVETPLTKKLPLKLKEMTKTQIPLENRLATPTDIANVILFLCKNESGYINGENILVTGGYTMH